MIHIPMYNWNTDTSRLERNEKDYELWRLEQQLNFGLHDGEKIDRSQLEKYLPELRIDQDTRNLMEFLLYGKKPAQPTPKKIS
jgi:hypothetical protein